MPIDISFVFADEMPAGKHGFLRTEGDHFVFEDGTRPKFLAVCLSGSANFPEHDYAEKLANRLAEAGVNCVRTHWMDSEFNTPNIFSFTKGPRVATTRKLDERSLERFDYLISCLKAKGIYIYLDNMTFRKFKSGDDVPHADELDNAAKPYSIFGRRFIDLQKEYITQLWTHVNPYTGLAYKDEPAVILTEVTNENDLFSDMKRKRSPYYDNMFREMYRDWLKENNRTDDWENVDIMTCEQPLRDFKWKLTADYYKEITDHLRATGVRIPVNGTNWYHNTIDNVKAQLQMDFSDNHHYYYDWCWNEEAPICTNAQINGFASVCSNLNTMRIANKPFFVSEWDMPWPNDFRAEGPIYYATVAALQDYDGIGIFAYQQGRDPEKISVLGSEMSSFNLGNYPFEAGAMSCWNDPAKFGLFQTMAMIIRRGDVHPAKKKIGLRVDDPQHMKKEALNTALETHRLYTVFDGVNTEGLDEVVADSTVFPREDPNIIASDTGEVKRYLKEKLAVIDTERTKVIYGMLARNRYMVPSKYAVADGFKVECHTDFAVVALSSLSDAPIEKTDNMMLTTIGRACNTGSVRSGDEILDQGHAPILSEVISATISIRTERTDLKCWAVNPEGYYIGEIPATFEEGWMRFTVGEKFTASYYLIVAE